ncbi:MAG TPA: hypothetical protein VKH42_09970, partial [Vicinamibacterales bacterium]|nr:hypothetical protein [Vicinamibacterales bacterium]
MRSVRLIVTAFIFIVGIIPVVHAQRGGQPATGAGAAPAAPPPAAAQIDEGIKAMAGRLDLEKYKATVKGLTQFGDRRQGTDRNRAAVDWIEAQLKSYGCPTERIRYEFKAAPPNPNAGGGGRGRGNQGGLAQGGGKPRGVRTPTGVNTDAMKQPDEKLRQLNMQPAADGP